MERCILSSLLAVVGCSAQAEPSSDRSWDPAALSSSAPTACSAYRNARGDSGLTITLRNSTDDAIYLQPYLTGCNDTPRLVKAYQEERQVFLERVFACGAVCQDLQGSVDAPHCLDVCSTAPLLRVEPGGAATLGPHRSQFLSHGQLPDTLAMSAQCVPGEREERSCESEAPLAEGSYELVARARRGCEAGVVGSCECVKSRPDGTCQTAAFASDPYGEVTEGIEARATIELADGNVTLVFE